MKRMWLVLCFKWTDWPPNYFLKKNIHFGKFKDRTGSRGSWVCFSSWLAFLLILLHWLNSHWMCPLSALALQCLLSRAMLGTALLWGASWLPLSSPSLSPFLLSHDPKRLICIWRLTTRGGACYLPFFSHTWKVFSFPLWKASIVHSQCSISSSSSYPHFLFVLSVEHQIPLILPSLVSQPGFLARSQQPQVSKPAVRLCLGLHLISLTQSSKMHPSPLRYQIYLSGANVWSVTLQVFPEENDGLSWECEQTYVREWCKQELSPRVIVILVRVPKGRLSENWKNKLIFFCKSSKWKLKNRNGVLKWKHCWTLLGSAACELCGLSALHPLWWFVYSWLREWHY